MLLLYLAISIKIFADATIYKIICIMIICHLFHSITNHSLCFPSGQRSSQYPQWKHVKDLIRDSACGVNILCSIPHQTSLASICSFLLLHFTCFHPTTKLSSMYPNLKITRPLEQTLPLLKP